jgi:hypothetical protein
MLVSPQPAPLAGFQFTPDSARVMPPPMAPNLTDRWSGRAAGSGSAPTYRRSGGTPLNFFR